MEAGGERIELNGSLSAYGAAWAIAFWLLTSPASAHQWYPAECCSGQDCREAEKGEILSAPDGYLIMGRWFRPHAAVRPSPDGKFHLCFPSGRLGCVFGPKPIF